jgi:hypothetical protein
MTTAPAPMLLPFTEPTQVRSLDAPLEVTSWPSALDALEQHVEALEAELDGGGPTTDALAWRPPAQLGRLPYEHLVRACALQERQALAIERLELLRDDVRSNLSYLVTAAADQHAPARAFVDRTL